MLLAALAVSLLVSPAMALAQGVTTAGVTGRVFGASGEPIPGARIELRHVGTGADYTAVTNEAGRFDFTNLRPGGPYTLQASRIGLQTVTQEGLTLSIGQRLSLEIQLTETAVPLPELSIRVEGDPEFDSSRMGAATIIDRRTMERLPSISRDFTEFAQLSPLVTVDEGGVSVAGSNSRFNNIQIDGALNQDIFGLSPNGVAGGQARGRVIPLSAIEELQVLIAPYDVRQSGFTGGVLNAVTKSGTNELRGSVFGFLRDDALVGDAVIGGSVREPGDLDNLFVGFDAGGPIVADRVHFFAAGELERRRRPPDGFIVGVDDPVRTRLVPDSVARVSEILAGYGADAGEAGLYTLENDLANLFARIDVRLDDANSAMLRYNFASADDDPAPNRLPGDAYELSSNGTHIESRNHSVVGQWLSSFSPAISNDLLINVQFLRDRQTPVAPYSRVELTVQGRVDGNGFRRVLRAGSNFFGQDSELDQDILQISNSLTLAAGDHRLTVGGGFERFSIRRRSLPGARGTYRFNSLDDLEVNTPSEYIINLPLTEDAATTRFAVNQFSGFFQDAVKVGEALNIRLGVRVDVPTMPDAPAENAAVESVFGFRTSQMPTGKVLFSPRLGFNLRLGRDRGTQIRGGAGIFTGRPPFAWLANAYQNTGLSSAFLTCKRRNLGVPDPEIVPIFNALAPPPTTCADGTGAESAIPIVTAFDPDFRFPQDFKVSMAIDQRLPAGFVLSLEGIYTKAVNQVSLRDLNIGPAVPAEDRTPENGFTDGFGFGTRESFGDGGAGSQLVDPPPGDPPGEREPIFFPRRVSDQFGQVILIGNRSENFAYAVSGRLRKRFGDRLALDVGYAFNRSADIRSLVSLDAISNFGFTAVEGDPNQPRRQASLFDRPHKLVASATAALPERLGGMRISLLYVGQSGRPYSYVYADDVNADTYPGLGQALDLTNDLIYVPESAFAFPGGGAGSVPISGILFEQLAAQERCLQESRLRILHRNACRTPWSNQLDLRIVQGFRIGSASVDLLLDVLNVLNLIDRDWGHVQTVNPVVRLLRVEGRVEDDALGGDLPEVDDPLLAQFAGPIERGEDGGVRATRPFLPEIGSSQWQAQLGLRIRLH